MPFARCDGDGVRHVDDPLWGAEAPRYLDSVAELSNRGLSPSPYLSRHIESEAVIGAAGDCFYADGESDHLPGNRRVRHRSITQLTVRIVAPRPDGSIRAKRDRVVIGSTRNVNDA